MDQATPWPPEVAAWVESYRPRLRAGEVWDNSIREFVLAGLRISCPLTLGAASDQATVLRRLASWCVRQGIALDFEAALDPDTVERFVTLGMERGPAQGTYRSLLRRLGPALTRRAPWEPRPKPVSRRHIAVPYTPRELGLLRADAEHQSTAQRRQIATALIALGAGAGLDARWALDVVGEDVSVGDSVVRVRVRASIPRVVPVLAAFEDEVLGLARLAPGNEPLVGCRPRGRNRANNLTARIALGSGTPPLLLSRLRSTWLVTHLQLGTRLPELASAAGLAGITVLSDLLAEVEPLDEAEAASMLRGQP